MAVIAQRRISENSGFGAAAAVERRRGFELRRVDPDAWDATISGFDEVCQEQTRAFAAARWPGARLEPILFLQGGDTVGGALILVQALPLGVGHIAVAKWAPMVRDAGRGDAEALRDGMVEALVAEFARRRRHMLSILPRAPIAPGNTPYDRLVGRGFRRGSQLLFPNRYLVDLRLGDAEQRASFQQAWRRQLNKADRQGLVFERADAAQLGEFDALYRAMSDRKQFPDHSAYDTVPALMAAEVPAALRPELFLVRHAGQVVAGALIFKAGDRAVYLYGATNAQALPLRAGYFMHWHIIRWLRDNTAARWYDLGGTDGFQGLHQFKRGMVGERGVICPIPPVANYAETPWALALGTAAFALRDRVQAARRTLDGWRNPKARPDQAPQGDDGVAS